VSAHVPDPGRLEDILVPNARIWCLPTDSPTRRTAYTVILAEPPSTPGVIACVDSLMANRAASVLLKRELVTPRPIRSPPALPTIPWHQGKRSATLFWLVPKQPDSSP